MEHIMSPIVIPQIDFWIAYILQSLTYNSAIFPYKNETNCSAGEKNTSKIMSLVIFYEQSQRAHNLVTQVWCLVYLSAGFVLSFPLTKGTHGALTVTSVGFTKNYHN